jgi:hypothetical protein
MRRSRHFLFPLRFCAGRVWAQSFGVVVAILAIAPAVPAAEPSPFSALIGTWSGTGQVRLQNGSAEVVKCKAYYVDKAPNVGISLRCASSGSKIDLRATLAINGSNLSGNWEERQFNAAGSLTGTTAGNRLSMAIDGGGLKASMAVTTSGKTQTLAIASETATFKGVTITLARD